MTTRSLKDMGLPERTIGTRPHARAWVENPDWLNIPNIEELDRVVGLCAINEYSTFFSFSVTTVPGSNTISEGFTVDWGNGEVDTYASGAVVEYLYDFNTVEDYNGLYKQAIVTIKPTGDDHLDTVDFNVAHTEPGLNSLYNSPWLSVRSESPYIKNIYWGHETTFALYHRNLEKVYLDCPSITNYDYMFATVCSGLREVDIVSGNGISFVGTFFWCTGLSKIPNVNYTNATDLTGMYEKCYIMKGDVHIDLPVATTLTNMFKFCYLIHSLTISCPEATSLAGLAYDCRTMVSAELNDTDNVLSFFECFRLCSYLQDVEISNVETATDFSYMFRSCTRLQHLPDWTFTEGLDFSYMLNVCYRFQQLPQWTFPSGTTFNNMMQTMEILTAPNWSFPVGTSFTNMLNNNLYLRSVDYYFPGVTDREDMAGIVNQCPNLRVDTIDSPVGPPPPSSGSGVLYMPLYTLGSGDTFTFNANANTLEVPAIDMTLVTGPIEIKGNTSLSRIKITGVKVDIDISGNHALYAEAIDEVFTNLETVTGSEEIDVSNNPGTGTCDTSIATAKGWTVITV